MSQHIPLGMCTPRDTAFIENVPLICGKDKLIAEPMKGTKKRRQTKKYKYRIFTHVANLIPSNISQSRLLE